MRIGHNIVAKLQEEGIEDVNDLGLVDNYFLNQITDNLKQPSGQINVGGVMVATPALKFGEKLQMRLDAALNIVRFYKTAVRAITDNMIQWVPIIKEFTNEWKILFKRKGEDVSAVTKNSKALSITKWMEYFAGFLHQPGGERNIPFSYVIRELDTVPGVAPLFYRG